LQVVFFKCWNHINGGTIQLPHPQALTTPSNSPAQERDAQLLQFRCTYVSPY
jgi:hypothetical protein